MKNKILLRFSFVAVLFLFLSSCAYASINIVRASTIVDTDIVTDTVWTFKGSPYVVLSSVRVASGATLSIEPDVVIKFIDGASLFVEGKLDAVGTDISPIYFTSIYDDDVGGIDVDNQTECWFETDDDGNEVGDEICETYDLGDPFVGDWNGVYFQNSTGSRLKNVFVKYADDTLTLQNSSASFEKTHISDSISCPIIFNNSSASMDDSYATCEHWGFSVFNGSSLDAKGLMIENIPDYSLLVFNGSSVTFDSGLIKNTGGFFIPALSIFNDSSFVATGSVFEGGQGGGFEVFSNRDGAKLTLTNSTIKNFQGSAISDYGNNNETGSPDEITLTKNKIEGNNVGFSLYSDTTLYSVSNNTIQNNITYGLEFYGVGSVDFKNNFWGDPTGPHHDPTNIAGLGNAIFDIPGYNSVAFKPFLTTDPLTTPECCSSVLFLPGLEASRLYKEKTILFGITIEDQLWEPNGNSDVEALYLNADGTSKNVGIYTRDIIKETNTPIETGSLGQNIYKSFSTKMDKLATDQKIKEWWPYAYDWRQNVQDIVDGGTPYVNDNLSLVGVLQALIHASKSGKVTIVAHSTGGLIAKALLKKLEDDKMAGRNTLIDDIDKVVLIASPQLGTPDAFSAILHGYDQEMLDGWLMDKIHARKLAQNMPSAYGLLPSKKYFEQVGTVPLGVFASTSAQIYRTKYGQDVNNYSEERSFILGQEGRTQAGESDLISPLIGNSLLFTQAEILHDSIDNMTFPDNIKIIDIAGWGKSTITGMTYTGSDIEPITTIRGDETVVMQSALYGQGTKYWLDLSNSTLKHSTIFEDPQLLAFLDGIITQQQPQFSIITDTEPLQIGDRLHLSAHSPVSIGTYDNQGNFTGKVCDDITGNCVVKEDIPGSTYFEFGEGKYVHLGKENLQRVILQGTDVGTFTFESQVVTPNGQTTTSSFVDIPVTTQTQAEVTLNTTGSPQLALDVTGDGVTDFTLAPSTTFDPITYLQIMKTTIDSLDLTQAKKNAFDKRVDNIIKSIQKGKIDKAKLKADKFKTVLEKKLAKPDSKKVKPKKLSKTDAQLLLDMLNGLLDNIN